MSDDQIAQNQLLDVVTRCGIVRLKETLDSGIPVNLHDGRGRTALSQAARLGKTEHLVALLKKGADANVPNTDGIAPLSKASYHGHVEAAKELIAAGAIIDYIVPVSGGLYHGSALLAAVQRGHYDMARFLLTQGAAPTLAGNGADAPLHRAACRTNSEICRLLLDSGADINQRGRGGRTPVFAASNSEAYLECLKLLVERGADVNICDERGLSPMHYAISCGDDPMSRL